jgi:hypothetical protein
VQIEFLRRQDCDEFQGFYFGPAVSAASSGPARGADGNRGSAVTEGSRVELKNPELGIQRHARSGIRTEIGRQREVPGKATGDRIPS